MMPSTAVTLPTWYGHLDTRQLTESVESPAASQADEFKLGPLTVFKSADGCQILRFGPDKANVALFDGYLFDQHDLAVRLECADSPSTEAELVAHAYERWGRAMFDHLDGAFLVAIWDAIERRFIIGHDALGKHPVYYANGSDGLWFSSNILGLAHDAPLSRQPNLTSLGLRLLGQWPLAGETFFADIHRLRPAHFLTCDSAGQLTETLFWWPVPEDDDPWLPDEQVIDEFEPRFTESVERCMQLDPQGILLSGGVDSVSVAAIAAQYLQQHNRPPLIAYSGQGPPGYPATYEDEMQDFVVQRLGIPHHPSNARDWIGDKGLLRATLENVPTLPAPTDIWWAGAFMGFYRHIAAEGTTAIFSGSGGDEWLGVDPTYTADLMRDFAPGRLLFFMRALRKTGDISLKHMVSGMLWNNGLRLMLRSLSARLAPQAKMQYALQNSLKSLPDWLFPDPALRQQIAATLAHEFRVPELTTANRFPKSYYLHNMRFYTKNTIMYYEFERRYHVNSMIGLQIISPYHDRRMIDFMNRVSPDVLLAGRRYKGLLRPLAEKYLPDLGLENQKKITTVVGNTYTGDELRNGLPDVMNEVGCAALDRLGLVDTAAFARMRSGIEQLPLVTRSRLFNVLSTETWLNAHR